MAEAAPDRDFIEQLSENDHLQTGPLAKAGLENFDIMVRSPGISPYRNSIQQARAAGASLTTPSKLWFAAHTGRNTICITGTKGKSTTSALLAHMLESCGCRVRLAGNIGLPLLACDDQDVDWWVIELSSYQLADLEADPAISVILNLSSDHLDWHGDEQTYRDDKLRLVTLAGRRPLIANASDPVLSAALSGRSNTEWFNSKYGFRVEQGKLFDGDTQLPALLPEGLPGAHNLSNIAAALTVLRLIGARVSDRHSEHNLVPLFTAPSSNHRRKSGGAFCQRQHLISPGRDDGCTGRHFPGKWSHYWSGDLTGGWTGTPYMDKVRARLPNAVIGIPGNGPRIIREMQKEKISPIKGLHESQDLAEAVALAQKLTPAGGIVLLSPGAPSFPQFRDYRDRGRQFAQLCGFAIEERNK